MCPSRPVLTSDGLCRDAGSRQRESATATVTAARPHSPPPRWSRGGESLSTGPGPGALRAQRPPGGREFEPGPVWLRSWF